MENRIARFIAGLRASGVRVSLAESQDAWRGIDLMGVADQGAFYLALRSTLVKEAADIPTFDELFPLYFGTDTPPLLNPQAELSPDEQDMLQQALEQLSDELAELLSWLMSGQGPTQEDLQELAEQAGMQNADAPHQARWYARRMQRRHGLDLVIIDYLQLLQPGSVRPTRPSIDDGRSGSIGFMSTSMTVAWEGIPKTAKPLFESSGCPLILHTGLLGCRFHP